MSSVHAANTETIHLSEPSKTLQLPSSPTAAAAVVHTSDPSAYLPTRQDSRDSEQALTSEVLDGRSSDADKMFQSGQQGSDQDFGDGSSSPGGAVVVNGSGAVDAMDQGGTSSDDAQQYADEDSHELKRVKVYELIGARWVDQGTAFCFGDFQDNEALLIARAEADFNHIILSTTIRSNDVYQRQQDTLIVWTEPDGVDYALSFQDPDGCAEVWNFIQEVQRHMNTAETGLSSSPMLGEQSITTASIIRSGHLPRPALGIIGEIDKAIKAITRTPNVKERVCEYIQTEDYIKALIDVFTQAEDLESLENLHALCTCMQTILMLNDHSMYEHILEDNIFFGVVGMLEYDPEFPTYKANYREFLHQTAHFHQPIPIRDVSIQKKVHHTYRLQFLKDVVLARAIDDSTFNVLNSCIIFNQIDIINHVQNDQPFLREVVGMFMDDDLLASLGLGVKGKEPESPKETVNGSKMDVDLPESKPNGTTSPHLNGPHIPTTAAPPESSTPQSTRLPSTSSTDLKRRREVVYLIQQLCVMGKNVQLPARMALFRTLVDRGVLFAVQWALGQPETEEDGRQMIAAAGEILMTLLDHDLNGVRGHVVKQLGVFEREKEREEKDGGRGGGASATGPKKGAEEKDTVLLLMCRVLVRSKDLAVQSQVGEALKMLMEIPPNDTEPHPVVGAKLFQRAKDDPATEKFLDYFYKSCVETLYKPLFDIPQFKELTQTPIHLTRERTNLLLQLCELLSQFALQHSFRSHFFILGRNLDMHVASIFSAKDKHLRLAAFRFFRTLLRLSNRNLFNQLIRHDTLKPILELTVQESRRDNLLSSSCQEFFEHIRRENFKDLINHCMTKHEGTIKLLADTQLGGPRFKAFIRRWEMNVEPPPKEEEKSDKTIHNGIRRWGQGRLMEVEEEDYFNADDDEDEILPVLTSPFLKGATTTATTTSNTLKRKRPRGGSGSLPRPGPGRNLAGARPVPLPGLGEYGEDDDNLGGVGPTEEAPSSTAPNRPIAAPSPAALSSTGLLPGSPMPQHGVPPSSPRLPHRQISLSKQPPASASSPEDDMDNVLEALISRGGPPSPSLVTAKPPDLMLGSKRRRDDDDDELLERLATKSKRPTVVLGKEKKGENGGGRIGPAKHTEDGPKKIKLKLATSTPSTPSTPSPSSNGAKDGDTG